jgi:heme A synthase
VVAAIIFNIVNIFLGLYMAFFKKEPRLIRMHLYLYITILICLVLFLVMNGVHSENTIWEYLIGLYFITLVPLSRKWDVLIHALIAIVGLILLPLLILLQMY